MWIFHEICVFSKTCSEIAHIPVNYVGACWGPPSVHEQNTWILWWLHCVTVKAGKQTVVTSWPNIFTLQIILIDHPTLATWLGGGKYPCPSCSTYVPLSSHAVCVLLWCKMSEGCTNTDRCDLENASDFTLCHGCRAVRIIRRCRACLERMPAIDRTSDMWVCLSWFVTLCYMLSARITWCFENHLVLCCCLLSNFVFKEFHSWIPL